MVQLFWWNIFNSFEIKCSTLFRGDRSENKQQKKKEDTSMTYLLKQNIVGL